MSKVLLGWKTGRFRGSSLIVLLALEVVDRSQKILPGRLDFFFVQKKNCTDQKHWDCEVPKEAESDQPLKRCFKQVLYSIKASLCPSTPSVLHRRFAVKKT